VSTDPNLPAAASESMAALRPHPALPDAVERRLAADRAVMVRLMRTAEDIAREPALASPYSDLTVAGLTMASRRVLQRYVALLGEHEEDAQ
jgi:hypothetical protein